ncbi:hypothetical protein [Salinithrix halophila]
MDNKQLHQKVIQVKEMQESGVLRFEQPNPIADSLSRVRFDETGQVDPKTVDPNVKALLTLVELY